MLEKKWESLFSRSYLGITGGKPELNWESDYLQGIKRVRRLYCNVGIGFHLQVLPDGGVSGAHSENQYSESACGTAGPRSSCVEVTETGTTVNQRRRRRSKFPSAHSSAHSPRPSREKYPRSQKT